MAGNFKGFLVGWLVRGFSFSFADDNCPDNWDYPSFEYSSTSVLIICKFTHHFTEFIRQEVRCSESLHYPDFGYVQQGTQLFFMYAYRVTGVNSAGDFKHCVFRESGVFMLTTVWKTYKKKTMFITYGLGFLDSTLLEIFFKDIQQ